MLMMWHDDFANDFGVAVFERRDGDNEKKASTSMRTTDL